MRFEPPPTREEEVIAPAKVQARPRKPGKTLEDVVNANYCPPPLWLENKEKAAGAGAASELRRSTELVQKPIKKVAQGKGMPAPELAAAQTAPPVMAAPPPHSTQRVETLLLELLLLMRRGEMPTENSPAQHRRSSFNKSMSQESVGRASTPTAPKRRASFTKHHVIGGGGGATSPSHVTQPKIAGKDLSLSPPEKEQQQHRPKIEIRKDSSDGGLPKALRPKPIAGMELSKDHRKFEEESVETLISSKKTVDNMLRVPQAMAGDKSLSASVSEAYSEDFE